MTKTREYLDFNLELRDLDEKANTFKVAVLPSPAVGETQQAQSVSYRYEDIEDYLSDLERKRIDQDDLIKLGELLAEMLLPAGEVRQLFLNAIQKAGRDDRVRLRLIIRDPKLAQLPWEFSYLQLHKGEKDRRHFLVLNPQISMVRHQALPEPPASLEGAAPQRLRLLAAMANVEGYRRLQLKREKEVIEQALSEFDVDGINIEWEPFLEETTANDLALALQKGVDMFHFAGHGRFDEKDRDPKTGGPVGVGSLVLVKDRETRSPHLLEAGELALQLKAAGVRVAVLGACDSGRRDGVSEWTGVAPALIEGGVPAVIAMQYEVVDDHAIAFSQMFYSALAGGLAVDEAVTAGRLAMLGVSDERNVEWGVPVLYMRAIDGHIFPKLAERESETADEIRSIVQQTVDMIENGSEVIGISAKRVGGSFKVTQRVKKVTGKGSKLIGLVVDDLGSFPESISEGRPPSRGSHQKDDDEAEDDTVEPTGHFSFGTGLEESTSRGSGSGPVSAGGTAIPLKEGVARETPVRSKSGNELREAITRGSSTTSVTSREPTRNLKPPMVEAPLPPCPEMVREPAAPPAPLLTRYPNVECPDQVILKQKFSLFVQLLIKAPQPQSEAILVEDTGVPEQQPEVEVVLRAQGFDIEGSNSKTLHVERDDDSEKRFILIPTSLGEQEIRVDFYQQGRRIGTARRKVMVVEKLGAAEIVQPAEPAVIELKTTAFVPPPDLELCVELDQHDGRTLRFTLHSTLEAVGYHHARAGQMTLQSAPMEKVQKLCKEMSQMAAEEPVTNQEQVAAQRRLASLGNNLWDELIPDELKREYWSFKPRVKSLLITSDEPWIPWEMIKPYRFDENDQREDDTFWCQQFAISRWLSGPGTADELLTGPMRPVAPISINLASVKAEVEFLGGLKALRSAVVPLAAYSDRLQVIDWLEQGKFAFLHFACHGLFDATLPNDSALQLSDGLLRPSDIRARFGGRRARPLIFINACHGARMEFSFTGLGGWADRLVKEARVGAFIGALWEVNDELALQFARSFYNALLKDNQTFAEAFRQARAEIRQAKPYNPTWLAYVLYADPEGRVKD